MAFPQSMSALAQDLITALKTFDAKMFSCGDLVDKPKTFMLAPGYFLVLSVSPDESTSVTDDGCAPGKFSSWVFDNSGRPEGFTGAAVKIAVDGCFCLWWEPERDGKTVYNDEETIRYIKNLLRDGYCQVEVKFKGPAKDLFGNEHTVTLWQSCSGAISWPGNSDDDGIYDMFKEMLLDLEQAIQENFNGF